MPVSSCIKLSPPVLTDLAFGINRFGASGPYLDLYKKFGFTPEGIAKKAKQTIDFFKDVKPLRSPLVRPFEDENVQNADQREPS